MLGAWGELSFGLVCGDGDRGLGLLHPVAVNTRRAGEAMVRSGQGTLRLEPRALISV